MMKIKLLLTANQMLFKHYLDVMSLILLINLVPFLTIYFIQIYLN
jgi:hypothetical protein